VIFSFRKFLNLHQRLKLLFALLASIFLAGCVAGSALPPQNLGTLLSTEETAKQEPTNSSTDNPLEKELPTHQTPVPEVAGSETETNLSPAVRSALVPAPATTTPPHDAVSNVAITPPPPALAPPPHAPEAAPATIVEQKPEPEPASKPKPKPDPVPKTVTKPQNNNNLFAALARNNEAGNVSKKTARKSSKPAKPPRKIRAEIRNGKKGLPGVRLKKIFGIDSNETEEFDEPVKVAGVANLARRGTNGLLLQRRGVKVGCFPPRLLRILKQVERRFGRSPIVSSGYRSKAYNRRVGGARNSTHIRCIAADIQVKGVSKWKLARYLRSIPGRGGVGTYCYTNAVHIDIGAKRAWNSCRRTRKGNRRKRKS